MKITRKINNLVTFSEVFNNPSSEFYELRNGHLYKIHSMRILQLKLMDITRMIKDDLLFYIVKE